MGAGRQAFAREFLSARSSPFGKPIALAKEPRRGFLFVFFSCLGAGSLKGPKAESQRLLYGRTGARGSRTGVAYMRGMCSKPWLRLESWLVSHACPVVSRLLGEKPRSGFFIIIILRHLLQDFTFQPVGMGGVVVGGGSLPLQHPKGCGEPMGLLRWGLALRIKSDLPKKISEKMPLDPGHPLSQMLEGSERQTLGLISLDLCKGW